MAKKIVEISIYGAERLCPSCVNLPSSKETFEWLQAAITRKYPNQPIQFSYIDLDHPPNEVSKQKLVKQMIEEDLFYPLVLVEDTIVAEGNPRLKVIYKELEKYGYQAEQ